LALLLFGYFALDWIGSGDADVHKVEMKTPHVVEHCGTDIPSQ
jgi:hypothetical protein